MGARKPAARELPTFPVIPTEAAYPERRAFILALGATNVVFLAVDAASAWPRPALVLGARLVLQVVLVATPLLLGRGLPPRAARGLVAGAGAACAACFGVLAFGTGGLAGPYLGLVPLLPIIYLIGVPDAPLAALLTGAVGAACGLPLVLAGGASGAGLAVWIAGFASATAYATAGAALHLRVRRREQRAREERAHLERRQAGAARLALAGRLAAGVAHGVNNPLSAALGSLGFVGDTLRTGSGGDDPEVREALAEARASLERIRRLVLDLGALAREEQEEPGPCALGPALDEARRLAAVRGVVVEEAELAAGLPAAQTWRHQLAQLLAGVLVSTAEAGRGAGADPAALRVRARPDGADLVVEVEPVSGGRAARRVLEDDLLVLLAREQLEHGGGALTVADGEGSGTRVVLRLPGAGPGAPAP